jgi:large subunit ribosomal protein L15
MRLNTISPQDGSRPAAKRVGRGIGSGSGKTCGKGHKGQKARSGGFHKINFEGGQMPIQRRLPKLGFKSRKAKQRAFVTLYEISKIAEDTISIEILRTHGLVSSNIQHVKIVNTGEITVPKTITDVQCTKGAKEAILAAGGKIEE